MEPGTDEEQCDQIYANDETSELINIEELLKEKSLDQLLKEDREHVKEAEKQVQWYHGRITRDVAEDILNKGIVKYGNIDGLFLVRESSFSSSSFVLSLVSRGTYYHFQINEVKPTHFKIDEGPVSQGLDTLIQNYQEDIHGLPSQLTQFCKCKAPPNNYRRKGTTNLLHKAVLSENLPIVQQILDHKHCPALDAKNGWGSTALHDACYYGFENIAEALIRKGAEVKSFDGNGQTPLHRCCQNNKAGVISVLVKVGKTNLIERNPRSGWTALHYSAFKGHLECTRLLLNYHSPYLPRAEDDTTPLDLAERYNNTECFNEIEKFDPPKVNAQRKDWFHPELDRQGAQKLLEFRGLREGMFLVRSSKKNPDWHVLTMCHDQKVFNYEIKTTHYRDRLMHYIDDGPYYRSIEHLLQYYSYNGNGLPCMLVVSINPAKELIQILDEEDYSNLVDRVSRIPKIDPNRLENEMITTTVQLTLLQMADLQVAKQMGMTEQDVVDKKFVRKTKKSYSSVLRCKLIHADFVPSTPVLPPRPVDDYAGPAKRTSAADLVPPKSPTHHSPPPPTTPPPPPNHPPPTLLKSTSVQEVSLIKIDQKNLTKGNVIGEGEFGSVVKGVYKRLSGKKKEKIDVAIKLFHKSSINNKEDFLKEARTMQQLENEYIVNFLGISESDNHELMLVEEYIAMGSMLDYLCECMNKITKTDLYLWASQIACGMMYLEEKKMVHRDLAARNILLQSKHKAKISDFGLSRAVGTNSDYYKATTGGKWPIKWYAPECVNYGHFSSASDVWSFGVTLWEMFSFGEPPYGDKKAVEVIKFIEEGKRLEQPAKCPDVAYEQMLKCWEKDKENRPTFKDLNCHFEGHEEYVSVRSLMKRKK